MRQVLAIVMEDGKNHRLDVVIEDGHANVNDCVRIFDDLKWRFRQWRGIDLLGKITVAKKHQAPLLMAADFLASTYSMMRASKQAGGLDYAEEAPEPPKRQAGLTFLELLPDAMQIFLRCVMQLTLACWRSPYCFNPGDMPFGGPRRFAYPPPSYYGAKPWRISSRSEDITSRSTTRSEPIPHSRR
jgi:hypothetical protein